MAVIRSTADLIPDGWKGYLKAFSAFVSFLGAVLAAVQPLLPEGTTWARWVGLGVSAAGAFGVWYAKNFVKPVVVEDPPGAHEAPEIV